MTACTNIHGGSTFVQLKTTYDAEWVDCLSGGSTNLHEGYTNLHGGCTFIRLNMPIMMLNG